MNLNPCQNLAEHLLYLIIKIRLSLILAILHRENICLANKGRITALIFSS